MPSGYYNYRHSESDFFVGDRRLAALSERFGTLGQLAVIWDDLGIPVAVAELHRCG